MVRLKRVKGTRWLTGNTGFTLKRIARSSRPIVKVNCLTKLVDSLIIIIIIYYSYSAEYMWI